MKDNQDGRYKSPDEHVSIHTFTITIRQAAGSRSVEVKALPVQSPFWVSVSHVQWLFTPPSPSLLPSPLPSPLLSALPSIITISPLPQHLLTTSSFRVPFSDFHRNAKNHFLDSIF